MFEAVEHLDERERELWAEYERQEDVGLRADALTTLSEFTRRPHGAFAIPSSPPAERHRRVSVDACATYVS